MPIFVHWKWDEKHQDFIVVFHFDNDYSSPNLRTEKIGFENTGIEGLLGYAPVESYEHPYPVPKVLEGRVATRPDIKIRTVMTWAPTHIELALLTEILTLANIVNGLKLNERLELRDKLQMASFFRGIMHWYKRCVENGVEEDWADVVLDFSEEFSETLERLQGKVVLFSSELSWNKNRLDKFLCFQICSEYIDYLGEILKPYL